MGIVCAVIFVFAGVCWNVDELERLLLCIVPMTRSALFRLPHRVKAEKKGEIVIG